MIFEPTLASPWMRNPQARPHKRNLVIAGLLLLALGGLVLYDSQVVSFYQSTFNILPSKFFKLTDNLKDQTTISGHFGETSGRPVTFLIMNSLQFVSYQIGQGNGSLYALMNVASGSVSYTFTTPDTYYLVFLHGSGLLGSTETVSFQRSYYNPGRVELVAGVILVGLGVVELYWGVRPREARQKPSQKQTVTTNATP